MRYLFLIYSEEKTWATTPEEYVPWDTFNQEVADKNIMSAALHETALATTIRLRGDKVLTLDGPFAETKEQLGGFYVLDCKDLDEAMEIAARIPAAADGAIEIRPLRH